MLCADILVFRLCSQNLCCGCYSGGNRKTNDCQAWFGPGLVEDCIPIS